MSTLTISLSEERLQQLETLARRYGLEAEELVRASIEDLITRPEADFQRALRQVLDKNTDLYRRLA